jgi:magnesium-transporting ATPase (P-type)
MSKAIAYCVLIVSMAIVICCAISAPTLLNDKNKFLHDFINYELLGVMVVILTITLTSVAQLHLEFNRIEERYKRRNALSRSRGGVRAAAFWLIALFLAAILLVTLKPLLANEDWSETLFNGIGLVILLWNVLILTELTVTIFAIGPHIEEE